MDMSKIKDEAAEEAAEEAIDAAIDDVAEEAAEETAEEAAEETADEAIDEAAEEAAAEAAEEEEAAKRQVPMIEVVLCIKNRETFIMTTCPFFGNVKTVCPFPYYFLLKGIQ